MDRDHLQSLLASYVPSSEEDLACKLKFISFIRKEKRCFDRSLEVGHVTASAWLLNEEMTKALLMHHRKFNRWLQLGGHCEEEDVDILSAAIREAKEESGIAQIEAIETCIFDIDIHRIAASSKEKAHDHYDVRFLLRARGSESQICVNAESDGLQWIAMDDVELLTTEPSVVRLSQKWKNNKDKLRRELFDSITFLMPFIKNNV